MSQNKSTKLNKILSQVNYIQVIAGGGGIVKGFMTVGVGDRSVGTNQLVPVG